MSCASRPPSGGVDAWSPATLCVIPCVNRPVTLLDLLTGNIWNQLMFDTVEATGQETGIIFYVTWLILSRWLAVAMVVTVLFYRIDVDTENYLKIAAKTSMHSVFALEHAFMQVR